MTSLLRRISLSHVLLLFLLSFCIVQTLSAQTTATIEGTVADVQGGTIPNATVTITNTDTGIARTITTDEGGRYSVSQLIPGPYKIQAEAQGFKKTELTGIRLNIAQVQREDLAVQVGGNTETVNVEAQALTTDTESSSVGEVIDNKKVEELPLANRQFYNLAEIAPGVLPPAQSSTLGFRGGFNVNGAPETDNQFIVNGTFNNDMGTNQPSFRPSVETIAEFKVLSGIYTADYGRFAGGQIVMVTKQGGNQFHGSVYEYIRNGAIEAKPWSPNPQTVTPAFKQNTFGVTIGGPILRDKAFFFFGYEGQRIRQQIVAASTVPTSWAQAGCMPSNAPIYDPLSGAPLALTSGGACAGSPGPGYDISTLPEWNSPSAQLGRLMSSLAYPAATLPTLTNAANPSNNYNFDETRQESSNAYNVRGDYKYSEKDSFSGTWNYFNDPSFEPSNSLCSSRTLPNFGCFTNQLSTLANVGYIRVIKPTLLNDMRFGFSRLVQPRIQQDNTSIGTAWPGLNGQFNGTIPNNLGLPSISVTNYTATGGQTNLPQERWTNHFQFNDNLTWNHGPHTFKFGFDMTDVKSTEYEATTARGSLTFNNSNLTNNNPGTHQGTTGNAFGDMLLGFPASTSDTPTAPLVYNRYTSFNFFAMDDWKITPSLTLNLGLRYELDSPVSEKYGQISTFDLVSQNFITAATAGVKSLNQYDRNNFAPRIGFSWQPFHNEKTVVKGGFGIFYQEPILYNEFLNYSLQYPIRYPKTFTPGSVATGGQITLANPFPSTLPTPGTAYSPTASSQCTTQSTVCGLIPIVTGTRIDPHYATPYWDEWALSVQRQLNHTTLVEVGYYGSKGTRIAGSSSLNYNAQGTSFVKNAASGAVSATSAAALQALRIYPQWGNISNHKTAFNSEYESLQARLEERTRGGVTVLVSYTFGKSEDGVNTPTSQNPMNQSGDKGLSPFDVRHRLVISPVVALPFGKDQKFLTSGIASKIAGGWQISGIYQYFTGRPFSITDSTSQSGASAQSSTTASDRPDLIVGQSLTGPDSIQGTQTHNAKEWFNIHALAYNPPGTFGTVAPFAVTGPGWDELDLTIARTFSVREWAKVQFKVDAFNLANHPNFQNPSATYTGSTTFPSQAYPTLAGYGAQSGATLVGGAASVAAGATSPGSFGVITAANGMREIQGSIRITY